MPYAPDLTIAFQHGQTYFMALEQEECRLEVKHAGDLLLTTGKIVVCDPLTLYEATPFERTVSPGRYPVLLTMTRFKKATGRIAFARIEFQPGQPVRWEMAVKPGQRLASLSDDEYFGYGVDTGTGCFMDVRTVPLAANSQLKDMIEAELFKDYPASHQDWESGNYMLDAGSGLNVIAFLTGWGDGFYPSFWGFDRNNNAACLMTDFCLFGDNEE